MLTTEQLQLTMTAAIHARWAHRVDGLIHSHPWNLEATVEGPADAQIVIPADELEQVLTDLVEPWRGKYLTDDDVGAWKGYQPLGVGPRADGRRDRSAAVGPARSADRRSAVPGRHRGDRVRPQPNGAPHPHGMTGLIAAPVVDVAALRAELDGGAATAVAALDAACRDTGFFVIVNHGLDEPLAETFAAARDVLRLARRRQGRGRDDRARRIHPDRLGPERTEGDVRHRPPWGHRRRRSLAGRPGVRDHDRALSGRGVGVGDRPPPGARRRTRARRRLLRRTDDRPAVLPAAAARAGPAGSDRHHDGRPHRLRRDHAAGHRRGGGAGGAAARAGLAAGGGAAGGAGGQPRRHARPLDQRPVRVDAASGDARARRAVLDPVLRQPRSGHGGHLPAVVRRCRPPVRLRRRSPPPTSCRAASTAPSPPATAATADRIRVSERDGVSDVPTGRPRTSDDRRSLLAELYDPADAAWAADELDRVVAAIGSRPRPAVDETAVWIIAYPDHVTDPGEAPLATLASLRGGPTGTPHLGRPHPPAAPGVERRRVRGHRPRRGRARVR